MKLSIPITLSIDVTKMLGILVSVFSNLADSIPLKILSIYLSHRLIVFHLSVYLSSSLFHHILRPFYFISMNYSIKEKHFFIIFQYFFLIFTLYLVYWEDSSQKTDLVMRWWMVMMTLLLVWRDAVATTLRSVNFKHVNVNSWCWEFRLGVELFCVQLFSWIELFQYFFSFCWRKLLRN